MRGRSLLLFLAGGWRPAGRPVSGFPPPALTGLLQESTSLTFVTEPAVCSLMAAPSWGSTRWFRSGGSGWLPAACALLFPVRDLRSVGFVDPCFRPQQVTKLLTWLFRKANRLLLKKKIPSIIRSKKRGANSMVEVRSAFKTLKVRNPLNFFRTTKPFFCFFT